MIIRKEALQKMFDGTKEERYFLASHSFGLFLIYYFAHYLNYALADYHYDFFDDAQDLVNGDIREVAWIAFRESGKTSYAKIFTLWLITFKKRRYINIDSFDKENSERLLFDVAFEMTTNKRYIADFGILFSRKKGNIDDIKQNRINNFVTENGIRVEAHSTQESVRGRLHMNYRPDALILDDFENNKTRDSDAYTKQVADHISEAMSGMSPDGFMLYLGNYITEYGNVQVLFDRAKNDKNIRVRNIPVMYRGEDGKMYPTWKDKYVLTDREAKATGKVSIEAKELQLGPAVFSYEMMNTPIDESMAEFKKEWLQPATLDDIKHLSYNTFITIDSAVNEDEDADFTGITINRVTSENKWYITCYEMKFNSAELIEHMFYLDKEYKPVIMGMEETLFTKTIQPFFEDEKRKRNHFFTVQPLKHAGRSKNARIRGLIPRMASKSVYSIGDCSGLLKQMRVFPRGGHDDVLDSLAYQEDVATRPSSMQEQGYTPLSDTPLYKKDMVTGRITFIPPKKISTSYS